MAEVTTTTDFTPVNPVYYWTQRVLPLVYEDSLSRTEIMGKIIYTLNQVIKDMNLIPELIAELIKEYITSGAIEGVITEILLNTMINVKYPPNGLAPAKGDGTTDDTATIQGCIDYAATVGGMVLIPYGKYLTGSLEMKSNTALVGNDKYCSILVAKGGITNPFIGGNVYNFTLRNLTLDAQGAFQVNTVDGVSMTVNDVHFDNLIIKNSNSSMLLEKNGGQIELNNILFDTATDSHLVIGGINGHLNANTLFLESISTLGARIALMSDSNGDVFDNIYINSVAPVGLQLDGDNNTFKGIITSNSVKKVEDNGTNNNITVDGVLDKKYYSDYISFKTVGYTEEIMGTRISNSQSSTESVTNGKVITAKTIDLNSTVSTSIKSADIILNPTNPLTYKTPQEIDSNFDFIPFKDANNVDYKVLVYKGALNLGNRYDTLADAIAANLPLGSTFQTLGYNTINDGGGMTYVIEATGTPDGGSVISYNDKFAIALFEDEIRPEYFGIEPDMGVAGNAKWTAYQDYVNKTPGKSFRLMDKEYIIYQPFIFFKNLVGTIGLRPTKTSSVLKAGVGGNFPNISTLGYTTRFSRSLDYSALACTFVETELTVQVYKIIKNVSFVAFEQAQCALFVADDQYLTVNNCEFQTGTLVDLYLQSTWGCTFDNIRFYSLGKYSIKIGAMGAGGSNYTTMSFNNVLIVWVSTATAYENVLNVTGSGNTLIFNNFAMDNPNAGGESSKNMIRISGTKSVNFNNIYCENIRANHIIYASHCNININGAYIYNGNFNDYLYMEESDTYGILNNYAGPVVANGALMTCLLASGSCQGLSDFATNKNLVVCSQTGRAYFKTEAKEGYVSNGVVYEVTGTPPTP